MLCQKINIIAVARKSDEIAERDREHESVEWERERQRERENETENSQKEEQKVVDINRLPIGLIHI